MTERRRRVLLQLPGRAMEPGWENVLDDFRLLSGSYEKMAARFELVDRAEAADYVLLVNVCDRYQRDARRLRALLRFPERLYVYDSSDHPIPFLPGIYPGISRDAFRVGWTATSSYLRWSDDEVVPYSESNGDLPLLFSFVGAVSTHPVRKQILELVHPLASLVATDDDRARLQGETAATYEAYKRKYQTVLSQSLFVLCPRGAGASSVRLFETMRAGRVPVVISDAWVPPDGPRWSDFSITISENDVASIPAIVETKKPAAPRMGLQARKVWEQWFAPNRIARTFDDALSSLASGRNRLIYEMSRAHGLALRSTAMRLVARVQRMIASPASGRTR